MINLNHQEGDTHVLSGNLCIIYDYWDLLNWLLSRLALFTFTMEKKPHGIENQDASWGVWYEILKQQIIQKL